MRIAVLEQSAVISSFDFNLAASYTAVVIQYIDWSREVILDVYNNVCIYLTYYNNYSQMNKVFLKYEFQRIILVKYSVQISQSQVLIFHIFKCCIK
jgi:hypothetical protein